MKKYYSLCLFYAAPAFDFKAADGAAQYLFTLTPAEGEALKDKALSVPHQMASCVCLEPEEAQELYRILYKLLK